MCEIKKEITCADSEIGELDKQIGLLTERHNLYVSFLEKKKIDDISFAEQSTKIECEINKLRKIRNKLINTDEDEKCIDEIRQLRGILLEAPPAIVEFDMTLFDKIIEKMIVEDEHKVSFVLRCGLKLKEEIAWN